MLNWNELNWNELNWNDMYSLLAAAAWKGTAILASACLIAFFLRARSAAARHLVWSVAFGALLALPVLSVSLPALLVPVTASFLAPGVVFETGTVAAPNPLESHSARGQAATPPFRHASGRLDWGLLIILVWAAGVTAAFTQMLVGWVAIGRIRRRARPFVASDLAGVAEAYGLHSPVKILESAAGSMPMTYGLFRPAILMPAGASSWSGDRLRVVLLHELAHVRRGDFAVHMFARIALSLNWWNPLAWRAWRELLKERERAADDLVLSTGTGAPEYAGHLLEIARTMQSPASLGWAAVAMARRSQLEGRLVAILDAGVNRNAPGRLSAWVAALLAVAIVLPLAALQAQDSGSPATPADVEATIRAATAQKNYDLLDNAATAAEALRKYDVAQRLLDSSLALRAAVAGRSSVDYGVGFIKLGDLKRMQKDFAEADSDYRKAIELLGNDPRAASVLINLGIYAIKKHPEGAIGFFRRAATADPSKAGIAAMWIAVTRQRQKNFEEAEARYNEALVLQDPNSPGAAATLRLYSLFLAAQPGREEELKSLQARSLDQRKAHTSQAAAGWTPRPEVYRIGGDIKAPSVLKKVEPEYSEDARIAGLHGTVALYCEIAPDGLAHNVRVLQVLGLGLDEKAIEAVNQWNFKPGTKDGQPVIVSATIEVNFRLL